MRGEKFGDEIFVVEYGLEGGCPTDRGVELLLEIRIEFFGLKKFREGGFLIPVEVLEKSYSRVRVGLLGGVLQGFSGSRQGLLRLVQGEAAVRGFLVQIGEIQIQETAQLGEGLRMIIGVDVNVAIVVDVAPALLAHDQQRGRLMAARVAAGIITGLERRIELLCELAWCGF